MSSNETVLDPSNQDDWAAIIDQSVYETETLMRVHKMPSLPKYLRAKCPVTPQPKNYERIVKIMTQLMDMPRPKKHPSFGYATPEEIKRLDQMGISPERDALLKRIEARTEAKGKEW